MTNFAEPIPTPARVAGIFALFLGLTLFGQETPRPPVIVVPPASLTEIAGNNVLLTVVASGTAPLNYQWAFNGAPISGATADRLLLTAVNPAGAGSYAVIVSNSIGSTTSAAALLSVARDASSHPKLIDPTFRVLTPPDNLPTVVVEQPDGKLLLGGAFTILNGSVAQIGIARLQRDGALDATFSPGRGVSLGGTPGVAGVTSIALQADGRILIRGAFTSVANIAHPGLARLNADGSVDSSFSPAPINVPAGSSVVGVQPDGKIIILDASNSIHRLRPDGSPDSVIPVPYSSISISQKVLTLAPDGKILALTAPWLTRLNVDGVPDPTFTPSAVGGEYPVTISSLADGSIGVVDAYPDGASRASFLNRDGGRPSRQFALPLDPLNALRYTFPPGGVSAAFAGSGKLYIAQDANLANPPRTQRRYLVRFNRDGTLDRTFSFPDTLGDSANFVLPLRSGQSLAVGNFTGADEIRRPGIVRLLENNAAAATPPTIVSFIADKLTADAGDSVSIRVTLAGTGPFTLSVNGGAGVPLNGNSIDIGPANAQQSATYLVTVSNPFGSATSQQLSLSVLPRAPQFTAQPQDASAIAAYSIGSSTTFSAAARGTEPFTYQWFRDGAPLAGATAAQLTVPTAVASAGSYTVVVTNSAGQTTSRAARLTIDGDSRISNLASRGFSGSGENALITGFVVRGDLHKRFLIRAAGPALTKFGLAGALGDPQLVVFDAAGIVVAQNDDWGTGLPLGQGNFDAVGAFRFDIGSKDSAVLLTLPAGAYTAVISGRDNNTGIALAEIYDADSTTPRLGNLSSRLFVGSGEQAAIPGIVISGPVAKKLLIRGVGPTLALFGVRNPLGDPTLSVLGPGNAVIAANDNWGDSANAAEIVTTSVTVGAFTLPAGSRDAAVIVTLPPGAYTALVSGANGTTGVALVEVYDMQ